MVASSEVLSRNQPIDDPEQRRITAYAQRKDPNGSGRVPKRLSDAAGQGGGWRWLSWEIRHIRMTPSDREKLASRHTDHCHDTALPRRARPAGRPGVAILRAADRVPQFVLRVGDFFVDMKEFSEMNRVYETVSLTYRK